MRRLLAVLAVMVVHLLLSVVLVGVAAGMSLGRLDSGSSPSLLEQALSGLVTVLLLPVVQPFSAIAPASWDLGLWSYLLFLLNSAAWGIAGSFLLRRLRSPSRGNPWPT
jgi:hypothetical protein